MDILLIPNGPPYGTERCYNALRLGANLVKQEDVHLTVFLMGDAGKARTDPGFGKGSLSRRLLFD